MSFPVLCARVRVPMVATGVVLIAVDAFLIDAMWLFPVALGVFVVGLALYFRVGAVHRPPVEVALPVRGRWLPVNSPATKVPSHGLHAYAQTYAIDLIHDPDNGSRPGFGWWPVARRPQDFPGFGEAVLAPAAGEVVRVHAWEARPPESHLAPGDRLPGSPESARAAGPGRVLGNHVVLDLGDGTYAALAHLKSRSVRIRRGDQVDAGQQVAECGNSGNSTEPHLHFQLMDRPSVLIAAGLPFQFTGLDDCGTSAVPANGQHVTVDNVAP